jgi:hypothetical protein
MISDQIRALLIAGSAAIGVILLADSNLLEGPLGISDCALVGERVEQLACRDKLAHLSAPEPFKGATAPALHHIQ